MAATHSSTARSGTLRQGAGLAAHGKVSGAACKALRHTPGHSPPYRAAPPASAGHRLCSTAHTYSPGKCALLPSRHRSGGGVLLAGQPEHERRNKGRLCMGACAKQHGQQLWSAGQRMCCRRAVVCRAAGVLQAAPSAGSTQLHHQLNRYSWPTRCEAARAASTQSAAWLRTTN